MNVVDFLPCPRCGCSKIEWTNSRDLNILQQSVYCTNCELSTFRVETMAFINLKNLDYESSLLKYNSWVKTNPKRYCEEVWE